MDHYFAHSENKEGLKHDLVEHLTNVARLASEFAGKFGAAELGYWAGLWHDLGKFHPDFQEYITAPEGYRGPDHSSAGAVHAMTEEFDWLTFLVAGHHAGLPSKTDLKGRLRQKSDSTQVGLSLQLARQQLSRIVPEKPLTQMLPGFLKRNHSNALESEQLFRETELFLRMVFSALIDADFLDTEAHFDIERSAARSSTPSLNELWKLFEADQSAITGLGADQLSQIRHEIYLACLNAADAEQGIFSLTVPTGGGKTRSGMAFALKHALRHDLHRVIVAIPYTSIIEQTADVYREIFKDGVLEHHSAVACREESSDSVSHQDVWARLASENWDAPIVVTTTVQTF